MKIAVAAVLASALVVSMTSVGGASTETGYGFDLATPNYAQVPAGNTGEHCTSGDTIRLTGSGWFDPAADAVEAEGTFVHFMGDGTVHRGRWVATGFVDFDPFLGPDPDLVGGVLTIIVTHFHKKHTHGGLVMTVTSTENSPGGFVEGSTVGCFTEKTGGQVVFEPE